MIFFFDENFPKLAESILEKHDHQWFDIRGTVDEGLPDIDLFEVVKDKKAVLLTTDKDFYHTVHFNSKPHSGIVVIALVKSNSRNIISKLKWVLKNFDSQQPPPKEVACPPLQEACPSRACFGGLVASFACCSPMQPGATGKSPIVA